MRLYLINRLAPLNSRRYNILPHAGYKEPAKQNDRDFSLEHSSPTWRKSGIYALIATQLPKHLCLERNWIMVGEVTRICFCMASNLMDFRFNERWKMNWKNKPAVWGNNGTGVWLLAKDPGGRGAVFLAQNRTSWPVIYVMSHWWTLGPLG